MAFCTSCGAQVADTARFCSKCGKPLANPASAASAPAPPRADGGALKVLLIIIAVVVGVVVISVAISGYVGYRAMRNAKIITTPSGTKITSSLGKVETTHDLSKFAQESGVEIYPGATLVDEGANVTAGNVNTVAGNLETSDPPDKVAGFYRSKYPDATVHDENGMHSIVSNGENGTVTISIEPSAEGKTHIHIARVRRKTTQ